MASAFPASTTTGPHAALTSSASRVMQTILAMLLGGLIVGMAGFSHIDAIHNAAHDTRHSNGFPCH